MNLDNAKTVPCHRQWPPRPQTTSSISEPGHTLHPRLGTIPGATSTAGRTTGARNRQHSPRTHQPRSQTSAALWTHRLCHPRLATAQPSASANDHKLASCTPRSSTRAQRAHSRDRQNLVGRPAGNPSLWSPGASQRSTSHSPSLRPWQVSCLTKTIKGGRRSGRDLLYIKDVRRSRR